MPWGDTCAGVIYRPHGSNSGGELMAVSNSGQTLYTAAFDGSYRDVVNGRDTLYLLTSDNIWRAEKGGMSGAEAVPQDGLQVAALGNKAVVLGLTSLTVYQP